MGYSSAEMIGIEPSSPDVAVPPPPGAPRTKLYLQDVAGYRCYQSVGSST